MMVNRNVVVQYKRNFLEASPESGNRFKCSPGENDRKEKEYSRNFEYKNVVGYVP